MPYELAEGMEQTKHLIESVEPGQQIAIFIGPEGGFDPEEIRIATEAGIQPLPWENGSCGQRLPDLQLSHG